MSVRQIANALKLSPSTVSLALRHSEKIPEATRQRVLKHAERIGYRPSAKLKEVMSQLRLTRVRPVDSCFGVISFYDSLRPWEKSAHLKRIFNSMNERAAQLGYRLEPLSPLAAGMTHRRFRSILETRGIRGLLSFGSPNLEEIFPTEYDAYAVVTIGLSIQTPLHRVTSHFFHDLTEVLQRVYHMGYRRPGLVLGRYEDHRSAHMYIGAYLAWCEHVFGNAVAPVHRVDRIEEEPLIHWLRHYSPDVVIVVHVYDTLTEFQQILQRNGVRVPQDLGVAVVTQILEGTGLSGMQQNQALMGAWAVELLEARIMHQDFGIPKNPRIEMVESEWIDGTSLRLLS
jgi:LacI family transcriptional regulator